MSSGCSCSLAAAAFGVLAWRPAEAPPAFDGAPWLQLALGALALGLALLPGLGPGAPGRARRAAPRGLRAVPPRRHPDRPGRARGGPAGPRVRLALRLRPRGAPAPDARAGPASPSRSLPVLAGGYGAWRFGRAPETDAARRARAWVSADRRFTDDALGLTLDIPEGWVALKPGNPARGRARRRRASPWPSRGRAASATSSPSPRPAGVATAEQYLDHASSRRRAERARASRRGRGRTRSSARSRAAASTSTWLDGGVRQREVVGGGARRLDGLRPRGLDARGDRGPARRPRRARARPRRARPAGRPPARGGRGGGGRRPAPLGPGRRAAHVPERGARPRARPGLPPLARRARPAPAVALEGRDARAHRAHGRDLRRRALGRPLAPRLVRRARPQERHDAAPRRTARWPPS